MRTRKFIQVAFFFLLALVLMWVTGCKKEDQDPYQVVSDIDGNVYQTIKIGNQVWMAENLKTKRYRNGDSIYYMTGANRWAQTGLGAFCYLDNNPEHFKKYGAIYNGHAIHDSRNIAPEGWHVPTPEELWTLSMYVEAHPGTSLSLPKALAAKSEWAVSTTENTVGNNLTINNYSGFNALPGGFRNSSGSFGYEPAGHDGYWWSSDILVLNVNYNNPTVNAFYEENRHFGYSVRCIKDY